MSDASESVSSRLFDGIDHALSAEHPVIADEKSGLRICFAAPSAAAVDAFHTAALHFGGDTPQITLPLLLSPILMDTGSRRITGWAKDDGCRIPTVESEGFVCFAALAAIIQGQLVDQ